MRSSMSNQIKACLVVDELYVSITRHGIRPTPVTVNRADGLMSARIKVKICSAKRRTIDDLTAYLNPEFLRIVIMDVDPFQQE